jgi:excisionase family DNA binding protein
VDEAATLLNVSRWTIYRWVHDGRLEATTLTSGSLRIFHDSVLALVEQNRTAKIESSKVPQNPT